jgi:hypothetical protein
LVVLAELSGEEAVEVPLEAGHLEGGLGADEEVVVGAEEGESVEVDVVVVEGSAEDPEEDFVGLFSGAQEEASLDGAGAGFDQGSPFGDVALLSRHVDSPSFGSFRNSGRRARDGWVLGRRPAGRILSLRLWVALYLVKTRSVPHF